MARALHRLSAAALRRNKVGLYADGGNLYLQVTEAEGGGDLNRSWLFRFKVGGKDRWMGGGSTHTVSLAEAREWAREQRKLRLAGIDPIAHRDKMRAEKAQTEARAVSFEACAAECMSAKRDEWRSKKHAAEWATTLVRFAYPVFGALNVASIDTPLVLRVLRPIWTDKQETASRLRGRIEAVLDFATAAKYRPEAANPARWSNHLEHLLASPTKRQIAPHAAMPHPEVPALVAQLRTLDGVPPRAFEFLMLTATRSAETLGATWNEIDLDKAVWTVPGHRMKAGKEHKVPLSARCIEILREMEGLQTGPMSMVFPGSGRQGRLAPQTFRLLLQRFGHAAVTVHGFRSCFRDWSGDCTNFPREICEAALAHSIGNQTEKSYRRGDALERRRKLMAAWSSYVGTVRPVAGKVVVLRGRAP
jgi:integrase